jgi:hypothetical protein
MATLSGNITATQRSIRVSDGAAVTPGLRVRVDDELIDFIRFEPYPYINGVRQKGLDATRWVVTRGVGDSVAASHLAGATLTAAVQASVSSETLAPPDPFADAGGGSGITIDNQDDPPAEVTTLIAPGATVAGGTATLVVPRLLGPFRVNFDTPEVSTNGVELAGSAFVAGAVIIRTWAVHTDPAAAWNPAGSVEFQVLDWVTQTVLLSLYDPKLVGFPGQELTRISAQPTNLSDHPYVSPDANSIGVYVDIASGTPTAGSADVYAVIVEPA